VTFDALRLGPDNNRVRRKMFEQRRPVGVNERLVARKSREIRRVAQFFDVAPDALAQVFRRFFVFAREYSRVFFK
jgi:hypothetical protein